MKRWLSFVLAMLMILTSIPFESVEAAQPKTDYKDFYAADKIDFLVQNGYVEGYEDGSVRPLANLTRAEFVTIINKAFKFKEEAEVSFTDVSKDSWYYKEIAKGCAANYIKGYPDGTFRPNATITKNEVASILFSLTKNIKLEEDRSHSFTDLEGQDSWVVSMAKKANSLGLYKGYEPTSFEGRKNILRGEAFINLFNLIKLIEENGVKEVAQNLDKNKKSENNNTGFNYYNYYPFYPSKDDKKSGNIVNPVDPNKPNKPNENPDTTDPSDPGKKPDPSDPGTKPDPTEPGTGNETEDPNENPDSENKGTVDIVDIPMPYDKDKVERDDAIAHIIGINDYQSLITEEKQLNVEGFVKNGDQVEKIRYGRGAFGYPNPEKGETKLDDENNFTIPLENVEIGSNRLEVFFEMKDGSVKEKVVFIERVNKDITIKDNITTITKEWTDKFFTEATFVYDSLNNPDMVYVAYPKDSSFVEEFKKIHSDEDGSSIVVFDYDVIFSRGFAGYYTYNDIKSDLDGYSDEDLEGKNPDDYILMAFKENQSEGLYDEDVVNMVTSEAIMPSEDNVFLTEVGMNNQELLEEKLEAMLSENAENLETSDSIYETNDDESVEFSGIQPYMARSAFSNMNVNIGKFKTTFNVKSKKPVLRTSKNSVGASFGYTANLDINGDKIVNIEKGFNKYFAEKGNPDGNPNAKINFGADIAFNYNKDLTLDLDSTVKFQEMKLFEKYSKYADISIPVGMYMKSDCVLTDKNSMKLAITASSSLKGNTKDNKVKSKFLFQIPLKGVLDKYNDRKYLMFITIPVKSPIVNMSAGTSHTAKKAMSGCPLGVFAGIYVDMNGNLKIECYANLDTKIGHTYEISLANKEIQNYTNYTVKGKNAKLTNITVDLPKFINKTFKIKDFTYVYGTRGSKRYPETSFEAGVIGNAKLTLTPGVDIGLITLGNMYLMINSELINTFNGEGEFIYKYKNNKSNDYYTGKLSCNGKLSASGMAVIKLEKIFNIDKKTKLFGPKEVYQYNYNFGNIDDSLEGFVNVYNYSNNGWAYDGLTIKIKSLKDNKVKGKQNLGGLGGEFLFKNIPNGKYVLIIEDKRGNFVASKEIEVVNKKTSKELLEIIVNAPKHQIHISGKDGIPNKGTVEVYEGGKKIATLRINKYGDAYITFEKNKVYTLNVSAPGFGSTSIEVEGSKVANELNIYFGH